MEAGLDDTTDQELRTQSKFDADRFLADLDMFIRFRTCVEQNEPGFVAARAWIKAFFDPAVTAVDTYSFGGFSSLIIRSRSSRRPNMLGDGHIFDVTMRGHVAHGSRPFLGQNAIERIMELYTAYRERFPNPRSETDWARFLAMTRINAGWAHNQIPDHCQASFDLRFTEHESPKAIVAILEEIALPFGAEFTYREIGVATYYPHERALAQRHINLLRQMSGKEPAILHSNGASNARPGLK